MQFIAQLLTIVSDYNRMIVVILTDATHADRAYRFPSIQSVKRTLEARYSSLLPYNAHTRKLKFWFHNALVWLVIKKPPLAKAKHYGLRGHALRVASAVQESLPSVALYHLSTAKVRRKYIISVMVYKKNAPRVPFY